MDDRALLEEIRRMMDAQEKKFSDRMDALEQRLSDRMDAQGETFTERMDAQGETFVEKMDAQEKKLSDMMDTKLDRQKEEILEEATHRMKVLLDTEVSTKFNLLAEGQEDILRRMPSEEDMDIIHSRLDTLEAMVRKHAREIAALKRAN